MRPDHHVQCANGSPLFFQRCPNPPVNSGRFTIEAGNLQWQNELVERCLILLEVLTPGDM